MSEVSATQAGTGPLVIIGGRLEPDNDRLIGEIARLSGGRIAVLPTASSEPASAAEDTTKVFSRFGIEAEAVPVHLKGAEKSAFDPRHVARIEAIGSVYFTGGDQSFILGALVQNGEETPVLRAVRKVHARGGLLAGSSAGAAMMSEPMILGGTSLEALVHGPVSAQGQPGLPLGRGLGFFPHGIVDQHFLKRGRLGRLLVAMHASGHRRGFGIDENTGMVIEGRTLRVVGERGMLLLELGPESIAGDAGFLGVNLSYLDDGDALDLGARTATPGPGKAPIAPHDDAPSAPVRRFRNIFGSYVFTELMERLMAAAPRGYAEDTASVHDSGTDTWVRLSLRRVPERTRVLRTDAPEPRYTGLDFSLDVHRGETPRAARNPGAQRGPVICLGNTPRREHAGRLADLRALLHGPVGILAAGAGDPRRATREIEEVFGRAGIETVDLGLSADRAMRAGAAELARFDDLGAVLFTGGDQRRLMRALLEQGRDAGVMRAVREAHRRGAALIGVAGAASAMSRAMIAGGDSYGALRYGVASFGDGSLVLDEGLGVFAHGLVDQRFYRRNRLGRLIAACAEENVELGFGLCEDAGIVAPGGDEPLQVFGAEGVVVCRLDPDRTEVQDDIFTARGVSLRLLRPGESFLPASGEVRGEPRIDPGFDLRKVLERTAEECGVLLRADHHLIGHAHVRIRLVEGGGTTAVVDVESTRSEY
ncbi:MAG: cyanophycinase [Byssovorax sp.]